MRQGDGQNASEALDQAMKGLEQLKKQQAELQSLEQALDQLSEARRQMTCSDCNGKGCKKCQGEGWRDGRGEGNEPGKKDRFALNQPGNGIGSERGRNVLDERTIKARMYDSRVQQQVGQGAAVVSGMAGGANIRGRVEAEIQKESEAIQHGSTDPLTGSDIPRKHSEHAREYFDRFREGN